MIRRFFMSVFLAGICINASGQTAHRVGEEIEERNPCGKLTLPPTIDSCWSCFQSLLSDCDKNNNNPDRRKACYEGANNFFTWCLGRVGVPNNPRQPQGQELVMYRGEGFAYDIAFTVAVDPNLVEVYIRDMDNGEPRQQRVNAFVFKNNDGSLSVFFDNNNLGLDDDNAVGIVTAIRNPNGGYDAAYADAYKIITPGDLDGDGNVDAFDLSKAWDSYASGEMSYEAFIEFLNKFSSR